MIQTHRPRPLHILSFAQTLAGGGVERVLLRLTDGWIARDAQVSLIVGEPSGPLAAEVPNAADTVRLGSSSYAALLGIAPIVARAAPDVIFCPGNHYSAVAAMLRMRLGRNTPPVVAKLSNALIRPDQLPPVAWGYRRWLRMHPRFVDRLVAMTPGMAREAQTAMAMPRSRIAVIPNPSPAVGGMDTVPVPEGRFILGVGRLAPQKRWDRLIAAFAALGDPSLRLVIAGEGECRAALAAQGDSLGLGNRLMLPGHVADPARWMRDASVLALTSTFEGVPGVLREAIAVGTPVVATESSVAVREIVTDPARGTVVPRDDAEALVAALRHWLGAPRPLPPPAADGDPVGDYLALFETLVRRD